MDLAAAWADGWVESRNLRDFTLLHTRTLGLTVIFIRNLIQVNGGESGAMSTNRHEPHPSCATFADLTLAKSLWPFGNCFHCLIPASSVQGYISLNYPFALLTFQYTLSSVALCSFI